MRLPSLRTLDTHAIPSRYTPALPPARLLAVLTAFSNRLLDMLEQRRVAADGLWSSPVSVTSSPRWAARSANPSHTPARNGKRARDWRFRASCPESSRASISRFSTIACIAIVMVKQDCRLWVYASVVRGRDRAISSFVRNP